MLCFFPNLWDFFAYCARIPQSCFLPVEIHGLLTAWVVSLLLQFNIELFEEITQYIYIGQYVERLEGGSWLNRTSRMGHFKAIRFFCFVKSHFQRAGFFQLMCCVVNGTIVHLTRLCYIVGHKNDRDFENTERDRISYCINCFPGQRFLTIFHVHFEHKRCNSNSVYLGRAKLQAARSGISY